MKLPKLSIHSERPAWMQVLRSLMFLGVAAIVVIGVGTVGGWAHHAWDRRQEQRRERAALAAIGLRRECSTNVDAGCRARAAQAAGVPVAFAPSPYADLLVSIGPPLPGANAFLAPVPSNIAGIRFGALEDVWSTGSDVLAYDVITAPASRPRHGYQPEKPIVVDGVHVDVWVYTRTTQCKCPRADAPRAVTSASLRWVWAEWQHGGHRYAAWIVLGVGDATPAAALTRLLPALGYTAPT